MNILFFLTPKINVQYLEDDDTVRQAIEKVRVSGFTALPIISKQDGTYVGTISEGDILWQIIDEDTWDIRDFEKVKITSIIDKNRYKSVKVNADIEDLLQLIMNQNFVPVVDDRDVFMGIITRSRVIEYYYQRKDAIQDTDSGRRPYHFPEYSQEAR